MFRLRMVGYEPPVTPCWILQLPGAERVMSTLFIKVVMGEIEFSSFLYWSFSSDVIMKVTAMICCSWFYSPSWMVNWKFLRYYWNCLRTIGIRFYPAMDLANCSVSSCKTTSRVKNMRNAFFGWYKKKTERVVKIPLAPWMNPMVVVRHQLRLHARISGELRSLLLCWVLEPTSPL